jgi:hypothetical protein
MRTDYERQRLDEFIADGWTAAELGEHARTWRLNGRTYPTAQAYQLTVTFMNREWARSCLTRLIADADKVVSKVNALVGRAVAVAHHSENKLTSAAMAQYDVLVITQKAFMNAANAFAPAIAEP